MARNEEKALTLFSRWQTFKQDFHSGNLLLFLKVFFIYLNFSYLYVFIEVSTKRPVIAGDCNNLNEALKWRKELVREVTKKISAIQNGNKYNSLLLIY